MENEGKDSLGTTGTPSNGTIGAPDNSGSPVAPATTTPNSEPTGPIFSSPDLAPPTPQNSPLPTDPLHPIQTVGTGTGDVIINQGRPKLSKKTLIGLSIGIAILLIALISFILAQNPNRVAARLLRNNSTTIESVENLLERAQMREVLTSEIMDKTTHEELSRTLSQFLTFEKRFAKINPDQINQSARANFRQLQSIFANQAKSLQPALELYNISYMIYSTDNSDPIKPYLENENPTVAAIAERFIDYVEQKQQTLNDLNSQGCDPESASQTETCAELVADYRDVIDSLQQSFSVPQAILFAYADGDIDESADESIDENLNDTENSVEASTPIAERIKQTIEELK